jgi:copper transport protein
VVRSARAEATFAAIALALTALLTGANPSAAGSSPPYSATLVSDGYLASVVIDPARAGSNEVHLYLTSPGGSLSRPDSVTVTIGQPERGIEPIPVEMIPAGANHLQSLATDIPFPGTWTLTITAIYDTFSEVVFESTVAIR